MNSPRQSPPPTLLSAAWIFPMDGPVLRDAAVLHADGRILAIGPAAHLRQSHPQAIAQDLGAAALLPGLINAHTHLELSDLTPGPPPTGFVDWILSLIGRTARLGASSIEAMRPIVAIGVNQSLRCGVTTAGDISKNCLFTRPALRDGPLRVISFGEIQAMAQRRVLLEERFAVAADQSQESNRLTVGISPHASYTVEPAGYRRCLEFSRQHHRPLATHLAENPEETTFLSEQTGPFRHLWVAGVNAWDDHIPRYHGGPIRFAQEMGLLDHSSLLAHVNYCDDDELTILSAGRASVVYCPRTHRYFGHPPHRWRDMLACGINVAVGTDSCASSPNLNILDDLRLLHTIAPEYPSLDLFRMATLRGAQAIQMHESLGSLTPGKRADFAAFPAAGNDPLTAILESDALPSAVWIDGQPIVWLD